MLPEEIRAGNYALYEQQSPWGYVLDREPVYFSVEETEETVVVEKYNAPQKGTITVTKEGEVFSHGSRRDLPASIRDKGSAECGL